jgi:hypothetical protein
MKASKNSSKRKAELRAINKEKTESKKAEGAAIQKLAAINNIRILPWNKKWIVFEETKNNPIFKAYFTIYFKEDTYRIALSGLLFYSLDTGVNEYWSLKSGRFKRCKSIKSAVNWIIRFLYLPMPDQVRVIENNRIQFRDSDVVKPYHHKGWRVVNNKAGVSPSARIVYIGQFHNL